MQEVLKRKNIKNVLQQRTVSMYKAISTFNNKGNSNVHTTTQKSY